MDPFKIEPVGYGTYAVAPPVADADVLEATRVNFERHTMQGLGAEL